ncbi:MAG: RNA polymerase sigma factor [Gammaproteobacteria bacterium]|nr:RNA polymerase sigma factor [Gammaproteobacteria bacterium]MDH5731328.1 RNA polymerase sigma factor [Gammaproteobacteria bacterium]
MWQLFSSKKQLQKQLDDRWQRLYRIAYSWCHEPHLASDLVQETMLKALKNQHQLKDKQAFDPWLYRIMNHCWIDFCRAQKTNVSLDEITLADTGVAATEQQDIVYSVRAAVAQLPMPQRQIITLIDLEEMSYQEVASILEIPIGTVMSRISRARKRLKSSLQAIEQHPDQASSNLRRVK